MVWERYKATYGKSLKRWITEEGLAFYEGKAYSMIEF
jgi:hypothetical protein